MQLPRDPVTARTRQLSRTVQGTKREAQRALAGLIAEVSAGKVTASNVTVAELLQRWLEVVAEQLSPTTVREYRRLVRTMLEPALGALPLRRVTTQRLDAYYAALGRDQGLSAASIRHVHAVLRGALGQAVRWGWMPSNPAATASPPKIRRREITPPAWTTCGGCWRRPTSTTRSSVPCSGSSRRPVLGAGEVCGLRWSDIDVEAGSVLLCRSVASVDGGVVVKDTKTHAARRIAVDADDARRAGSSSDASRGREPRPASSRSTRTATSSPPARTGRCRCTRTRSPEASAGSRIGSGFRACASTTFDTSTPPSSSPPVCRCARSAAASATPTRRRRLNVYAHFLQASDRDAADVIAALLVQPAGAESQPSTPD